MSRQQLAAIGAMAITALTLVSCSSSKPAAAAAPPAGSTASFCALYAKDGGVLEKIATVGEGAVAGVDNDKVKPALLALLAAAPGEIKADMQLIVDLDLARIDRKPSSVQRSEAPKLTTALSHSGGWVRTNC